MKHFIKRTIIAGLLLTAATVAQSQTFCGGAGTSSDPYRICTAEQLDQVRNHLDKSFILMNDIDLTGYLASTGAGYAKWGASGWLPIGESGAQFSGNFNGAGYRINGLWINRISDNVGLFGNTKGATISNVGVRIAEGNEVKGGDYNVGGLVGYNENSSVTNCYATGNVSGKNYVGGLMGQILGETSIRNCYSNVNVNGTALVGSFAGAITTSLGNIYVTNCSAAGNVTATITGIGSYIGGFTGVFHKVIAENCYATGNVTGVNYVGGLVGNNDFGSTVTNCYSAGVVGGVGTDIGGLAGNNDFGSTIINSFYDRTTSGQSDTGKGEPRTTAQMKAQSTFTTAPANWNFTPNTGVWAICEGKTYPFFQYQNIDCTQTLMGIQIITQPAKLIYTAGESLNLAGISVRLLYSNGSNETVTFADFAAKNITASPANGTTLNMSHNGTEIVITCESYSAKTNALTINPIVITNAAITVTAPVTGVTPNTNASGLGNFAVGSVTWTPNDNPFQGSKQYTARVTLTSNSNYTFTGLTTATINGQTATATSNTGSAVTLSYTFPATIAASLTGTVGIIGTATYGEILRGDLSGITSDPPLGDITYKWKRGTTVVGTSNMYILTAGDVGNTITLTVWAMNYADSLVSNPTLPVAKATPAPPAAPTLVSKTYNSVTLTNIAGYEYSRNGSTWQSSNIFTGLTPDTNYSFYQRIAETASTNASDRSAPLSVTTNEAPIAITVTAPVTGATPNATASGTGNFTIGSVTWTPSDNPFQGNKQYTATVTLTANSNFSFVESTLATINGQLATATNNTGNAITFSYQFPATSAAAITGIQILAQPAKLTYTTGELLDLTGVAIKLLYNDGTNETVEFADFAAKNITTNPANGTILNMSHNGTEIEISSSGYSAKTNAIRVNPAVITNAAITVTAPVTGATPNITASGTGNFTISSVMWTPSDNPFQGGKQYTARVTLTANNGYTFTGITTTTINGHTATTTNNTGNAITLSYQFPATRAVLTGVVSITGAATYGETIGANLTGITSAAPLGNISYEWKRGTTVVGTSNIYILAAEDIGNTITLTVWASNYADSLVSTPISAVAKRPITVTANDNQTKIFGNVDPVLTYTITSGTLINNDLLTGVLGRTAGENVGNYPINQGNLTHNYYNITFVSKDFVITPKIVTVDWENLALTYNGTAQKPTASITGVNETINLTVSGEQTNVGIYRATASFNPANANYTLNGTTEIFTIAAKAVTVDWENLALTYNGTAQKPTASIVGATGTIDLTVLGEQTNAGTYSAIASFSPANANYTLNGTTEIFTIAAKAVTVDWENLALTYNGTAQKPTASIAGVTGTINLTVSGEQTNAGTYSATASFNPANANYTLNGITESFTIAARAITVRAIDETIEYGQTPVLAYTITAGNLVAGDRLSGSLLVSNFNVGTRDITQGTLTAGNNYQITFVRGTLTVRSIDVSVERITVDGETANRSNNNFSILAQCGNNSVEIDVITADLNAMVAINGVEQNPRIVNLPNYGKNIITITVTSQGGTAATYTLTIDKPVPANIAYYDRFEGVLTVPAQIPGIGMAYSVEWYRNGILLDRDPSKGYIETKEAGRYYALINGTIRTCEIIQLQSHSSISAISVYPNPTSGELRVGSGELKVKNVEVFDANGRFVGTYDIRSDETFNISHLPEGVYLVKINGETVKVIKK